MLTFVSLGAFTVTALDGSALAGAWEVPSMAKTEALKTKTIPATNSIRRFIPGNLLINIP
jgi:hypothetical protein